MKSTDAVVVARLIIPTLTAMCDSTREKADEPPNATFEITPVITGHSFVGERRTIEVNYFGEAVQGQTFVIMATADPDPRWGVPLRVSERTIQYFTLSTLLPSPLHSVSCT
jgi:hypothetical protein